MNFQEILLAVKKHYSELDSYDDSYDTEGVSQFAYAYDGLIEGVGSFEQVDQHGGSDEGSAWYSVKYFKYHDVYIKIEGYYSSYDGTDFGDGWDDSCSEVRPTEKTITVYEKVS